MAQAIEDARRISGAEDAAFQALATALRAHGESIGGIMQESLKKARKEAQAEILCQLNDARSDLFNMGQRCERAEHELCETKAELATAEELAQQRLETVMELRSQLQHATEQAETLTTRYNDVCGKLIVARDTVMQCTPYYAGLESRIQTLDADNARLQHEVQELRSRDAKRKQSMADCFKNLQAFSTSLTLSAEPSHEQNPAQRRRIAEEPVRDSVDMAAERESV